MDTDPTKSPAPAIAPVTPTIDPAPAAPTTIDPAVAAACAIARGEQQPDPAESAISIRGAWRDLNARGRGDESYRRRLPAGAKGWAWVSDDRLPRAGIRASERRCSVSGEVFGGDLIAEFSRSIDSRVGAVSVDSFALVVAGHAKLLHICEYKRRRDGQYAVTLPDGGDITVASPEWR
ncbi:MAG: hypothetical protein KGK07_14745 [Chloroflexota bacterium]|nr:hypothetical protein [Chloroflexota bacterium]